MDWSFIIGFAILIEVFTNVFRFGFDLHSKSIQHKLKLPVRIHHMYVGLLIAVIGLVYTPVAYASVGTFVFGAALVPSVVELGLAIALSDVFHHFIILPAFHKKMDFP